MSCRSPAHAPAHVAEAYTARANLVDDRVGQSLMEKAARRGSETERTVTRARELRDATSVQ